MLRTDLKPPAHFKAVWTILKPSGQIVSGPGSFQSRLGTVQTTLKPFSSVERQVVIHIARVQLALSAPRKTAHPHECSRSAPSCMPCPCVYVCPRFSLCTAATPGCHSSSISEVQADISACALDRVPHSCACVCLHFPHHTLSPSFQFVRGRADILFTASTCNSSTPAKMISHLGLLAAFLACFAAVWPGLKPSDALKWSRF